MNNLYQCILQNHLFEKSLILGVVVPSDIMKLPREKPHYDKDSFVITKDGKVLRNSKQISVSGEKKYGGNILSNFKEIKDKNDKISVRDKKGQFVTKQQKEKFMTIKEVTQKRTSKCIEKETIAPVGVKRKGSIMKANLAITTLCTCKIIDKGYENEKSGQIVRHYYTVSSMKRLSYSQLIESHNSDYKLHELLDMQVISTKEVSFDD